MSESTELPDDAQSLEILEGRSFKAWGIENFIEEDFFSWLARTQAARTGVGMVRWIFSLLQSYNLRELSEDVLKSLYQELVDPETRHDLGEFYTPDWLAHRIVRKLLDDNPEGLTLDPACGSGTFLYLTIQEKRERLGDSWESLHHILESVFGMDIHPLAVIIAKTNYILALGDLLKRRRGTISIPVYLADAIYLPELETSPTLLMQLPSYKIEINKREVYLPEILLGDSALYDQAIELAKEFAQQNKGKSLTLEPFRNFLSAQHFPAGENDALVQSLFAIAKTLKDFIDADQDTIWAFVLKNIYKPLFFKRKFDFIIGNPPWISFRFMDPEYQKFVRKQVAEEYKLLTGRGELITHLEIATLFLVRTADLYLKNSGIIAFVLPRSLFTADQHDGLRRRTFKFSESHEQNLSWRELWDCENVDPLFKVPSCVLVASKGETAKIKYPIPGQVISGKLDRKNTSLVDAEKMLTVKDVGFSLHIIGKRSFWTIGESEEISYASYYNKLFRVGACIYPRSFWFVQIKPSPFGINPELPLLETADRAQEQAKDAYKGIAFKDTVESRFLYATLLSTDLLPFGHLDYRLVVLPIEPDGEHYRIIDATEARERGFLHLTRWLDRTEGEWVKRRGAKAERMTALGWLDYQRKLTNQSPQAKYWVIYNTSGTFLTAAVVEKEAIEFEIDGQRITARGFLTDYVTYYMETSNPAEAYYLISVFNAPKINTLIKPMQARGLWGPRHICKKVLELPIPQYDADDPEHQRLAELGRECRDKVKEWLARGGAGEIRSIGKLRSMARKMLGDELSEIDRLIEKIWGG